MGCESINFRRSDELDDKCEASWVCWDWLEC